MTSSFWLGLISEYFQTILDILNTLNSQHIVYDSFKFLVSDTGGSYTEKKQSLSSFSLKL